METSLMMVIVVLVFVGLGFFGGYYYEKQQTKEGFASLSKGADAGIAIGTVLVVIILCILSIIYYYYSLFGKVFDRLSR